MSETYPLSAFQRAMLSWDKLHPYNAVHAVEIEGRGDAAALRAAVQGVCRSAGIGAFFAAPGKHRFGYLAERAARIEARGGIAAAGELRNQLCDGLNHEFGVVPHVPLRWELSQFPSGSHLIALAYHHVVADAQAISVLLSEVLRRYLGDLPSDAPLSIVPPTAALTLDPPLRLGGLLRGVGRTLRVFRQMKYAHKMPDERVGGDRTECVVLSAAKDLHQQLREKCRARGVGLNDALLGAFGAAIAEFTPDRHTSRRRRKIALGSVMSLRRRATAELSGYFGVCLGDMLVLLDEPDAAVDAVITQVAAQTRACKVEGGRSTGAAAMTTFFVDRVWPLFLIPHSRRSYRKLLPLCGGVSTFVVEDERFGRAAERIRRYVRACPTGPATPLLLGPTVFAGRLELTLTYRLTCMGRVDAEGLLERTLALLEDWCHTV